MLIKYEIPLEETVELLKKCGLSTPNNVEYTIGIYDNKKLVAVGSIGKGVIKGLAVDKEYQGRGILSTVISDLLLYSFSNGINDLYIFTKYCNKDKLIDLGFKEVISIRDEVSFLERTENGIERYKQKLLKMKSNIDGKIAGIVVNCNPFTLGHQYLIEKASKENDYLFVIVVEEDASIFPFKTRIDLVKKGTKHLENVTVIPSGRYIISSVTFPSYFTYEKDYKRFYISLDLKIFGKYIAPSLSISRRYIGHEPFCNTTLIYNETMKRELPLYGIEVVEIERLKKDKEYISASKIRKLILENKIKVTKKFLPETTYEFLFSEEGKKIVKKIKTVTKTGYVNNK